MTQHRNVEWELNDDVNAGGNPVGLARRQVALQQPIRSELRSLNGLLRCPNFLEIPATLRTIRTNTAKPRRKRKA